MMLNVFESCKMSLQNHNDQSNIIVNELINSNGEMSLQNHNDENNINVNELINLNDESSNDIQTDYCLNPNKVSYVKKFVITFCVIDILIGLFILIFGFFYNFYQIDSNDYQRLSTDSILITLISTCTLLSFIFEICCFEFQTLITFCVYSVLHIILTIHIWTIKTNNIVIDVVRSTQLIVSIFLLAFLVKIIFFSKKT